jgi:hypothetical protein
MKSAPRPPSTRQLARSVGATMRGESLGTGREFVGATVFFSVLLVHDSRMGSPGLSAFLDDDFRRLLGPVPVGKLVKPLTIMTVQDHEHVEPLLGRHTLLELIKAYDDACPDRMMSFHNFLATSPLATEIVPNSHVVRQSERAMDLIPELVFGRSTERAGNEEEAAPVHRDGPSNYGLG